MRISDWSSDVCSSDLGRNGHVTRWKITVEYDGAGFVGWQRQAVGLSVQLALEDAIERLCGRRVTVMGAGRTDAGVRSEERRVGEECVSRCGSRGWAEY